MSPVLGRPPCAPRSRLVKPAATAPGVGEGTTATGKLTGAARATGPDQARRTVAGPRGTLERHAAGHNHGTRTGARQQRPPGTANPGSARNTRQTAAREKVPRTPEPPRPHTAPTARGKRASAERPKGWAVEGGRAPDPGRPTPRHEAPPTGALVPPPQRAKPARKSARCGVGDGSPRPRPPHPQQLGSGPRPHASKDGRSKVGVRRTPDASQPGTRRPPWAPLCRPRPAACAPPPPLCFGVARALRAVPVQGAGRAVPGGSCPSAFPAAVPCSAYLARWGSAGLLCPLALLGVARPPAGRPVFVCWLWALWGRHEGARGGRLSPGCGASGVGRSPKLDRPSFGACSRGPLPTGCGCGGCGRGDPPPNPTARALGSWLCALWQRHEGAQGGAPRAWVWGVRVRALSHPRPPVLWGVRPGPTTHWLWVRGVWAWGSVTNPSACALASWLCALWKRHEGARGGRLVPGCGASGVGRSPIPDCPSFGACGRGPLPNCCGCGGCGPREPVNNPTARALASWLCALWGRHEGAQGGGAPRACMSGVPGRALPHPRPHVLWGLRPRLSTHWRLVRGARALGPVTNPTVRALVSWLCALWGRREGARGGRLVPGSGASGFGRCPTPDRPSFGACGRGPLPTGCGCGGCGRWYPSPTPQRALLRAGFARCGGGTRAPGGGRLVPGCGAPGVGRSPIPDRPSFGVCSRGPLPTGCGCGGCGRAHPSPNPQRALLRAAVARCGGGMRAPGGGRLGHECGASEVGRSPTSDRLSFGARGRGPLPTGCGSGGCGRGDLSPTPQRALLRAGFAPCPRPPRPAARAAHTRPGHCTRQGSSSTQCYAPAPRLGSLRASPSGSHWRQASSTSPAAPAARATTHQGGGVVGKRLQPRLLSNALTGEWRNGEAGEAQGSEPCEPGGLRHQAGGAS